MPGQPDQCPWHEVVKKRYAECVEKKEENMGRLLGK